MILVTGGTGFLGSHVLYELLKKNQEVRAIYRNPRNKAITHEIFSYYENGEELFDRINWVECDLADYFRLYGCLDGVSLVYHVAGYVTFNNKAKDRLNQQNAVNTANIVNACLEKGNLRLCHVSSVATLGVLAADLPVDEDVIWNQGEHTSAYAKSKFLGEMEVWRGIEEGLNAVIVNPSVIIGPGMWYGPGRNLWNSVQNGLKYYLDGSAGYVDVSDVAKLMIQLAENDKTEGRYIISAGHINNKELVTILSNGLELPVPGIRVTPLLAGAALIGESIRALITGKERRFNRQTIKIASSKLSFSNDKVISLTGYQFTPIEVSIRRAIDIFIRKQQNDKKNLVF